MTKKETTTTTKKSIKECFPFDKFREYQEDALDSILEGLGNEDYIILEAPVGSGKSPLAVATSNYVGNSHIITAQKVLQDQYIKDFPHLYPVKGRSNYECSLLMESFELVNNRKPRDLEKRDLMCNNGPCRSGGPKCDYCPYLSILAEANRRPHVLHNFESFFFQRHLFSKRELMVIDEAHNIEAKFMNFISFSVDNKLIDHPIPNFQELSEYKKFFADIYLDLVKKERDKQYERKNVKDHDRLNSLIWKIEQFLKSETDYVFERKTKAQFTQVTFKPITVEEFVYLLFDYAENILLMSATILEPHQFMKNIGIESCHYVPMPSSFPVSNREIYYVGELDLRYRYLTEELPKLPKVINKYLGQYNDCRGIIHAHNNMLVGQLRNMNEKRFIFKDDFLSPDDMLKAHITREDSVIVGSGFHEGLDLKDDMSRFQIILKVPFPGLNDQQLKRRMELDKGYYGWLTSLKLIQSCGRSCRSKTDWVHTYIIDKAFKQYYGINKKILPEWFKESIVWS